MQTQIVLRAHRDPKPEDKGRAVSKGDQNTISLKCNPISNCFGLGSNQEYCPWLEKRTLIVLLKRRIKDTCQIYSSFFSSWDFSSAQGTRVFLSNIWINKTRRHWNQEGNIEEFMCGRMDVHCWHQSQAMMDSCIKPQHSGDWGRKISSLKPVCCYGYTFECKLPGLFLNFLWIVQKLPYVNDALVSPVVD